IIAIENRFGLKYWEGAKEDHTGGFFEGLEGYSEEKGVRTFSRTELEKLAENAGFKDKAFFYPYPDYKLPLMIFSDQRLPGVGELRSNIKNYDSEKMSLFDQGAVFDGIIENGKFDFFANSYVCIMAEEDPQKGDYPQYVKYNARIPAHNLKTSISVENGKKCVKKAPRVEAGSYQIDRIKRSYDLLTQAYDDDKLSINKFTESEGTLSFEYLEGRSFEDILDEVYAKEGYDGVLREVKKYIEVIKGREGCIPFSKTQQFIEVFGNIDLYVDIDALGVANVDMIFGNILVNDKWNLIDYEWTFDFPVPLGYIIYRALMVYINFTPERRKIYRQGIFTDLGLSERELNAFRSMDAHFYDYALGVDNEYVSALKSRVDMKKAFNDALDNNYAKVYFDRGKGFNEEDTALVPRHEDMCGCLIELDIPKDVVSIRIDPVEKPCLISNILALTEMGYSLDFSVNGRDAGDGRWIFDADPQIIFSCVSGHFKLYMSISHHGRDIFKVLTDTAREKDNQVNRYNELVTAVNNKGSIPRRVARKIKRSILGVFDRPGNGRTEEDQAAGGIRKFNFAVVVDASRIDEERLKFTMYSLACQTYRPYDIRLFGGSCEPEEVTACMNDYIKSSNADYYVLLKCGDALSNDALYILNEYANNYRPAAIYSDEKRFNLSIGDSHATIFKPDFAIDTLRSSNYIGAFGVFEKGFLEEMDGINEDLHDEYIYDLFLKAWKRDDVGHIQEILHYARVDAVRNYDEEFEALKAHVKEAGLPGGYVTTDIPGIYRPRLEVQGEPLVSVIIPNKDGADLLRKCIDSIENLSTYKNYEIIIIENNSITNEIFDLYEELKKRENIRIETWTKGWNYAAINNFGAGLAKGDYLLLLNNDIEVISPDWIEEMLMFAQ
ncbi:MAG: glycosyltransferase, partial [Lachnospiraceae bacterium]|nr:glycosyltransferase [Lachnospiraceae bacterium]